MKQTQNTIPKWVEDLCHIVSEKIGRTIKEENVHSDELGWKGYIPSCSLLPQLPLLMCDEVGEIHIIIPACSYKSLGEGKYSVETFFEESYWHYGYYHGGCDVIKAIFWQPLEGDDAIGITDQKTIQQFFDVVSKENVSDEELTSVCPKDDRKVLLELVKARVYSMFGYAVAEFFMYDSIKFSNKLIIKPSTKNGTVDVYLPSSILNKLMYYQGILDCKHFTDNAEFWIARRFGNEQIAVPKNCVNLDQFCRTFWRDLRWYNENK